MATKPTIYCSDLRPRATARGLELLPEVAKALLSHVCLDQTRLHLCGLGIDGSGESAWLCATDGHRALRMPIRGEVPAGVSSLFPVAEVNAAILRAKAGDVKGHGDGGATLIVLPWLKATEVRFVPMSQVFPTETTRGKGDLPWVNPHYLADAARVGETFAKATRTETMIAMRMGALGDKFDPTRFDLLGENGEIVAQIVIMPMRVEHADLPKTHRRGYGDPVGHHEAGPDGAEYVPPDPEAAAKVDAASTPVKAPRKRATKAKADSETAHIRAEAA
jgi:hypothetical protein